MDQKLVFSGTPTTATATPVTVTVTVTDAAGGATTSSFKWTIHGAPVLTLTDQLSLLTTPATAASYLVTATSPNGYALTYTSSGALPPGITFGAGTHTFSGTPTTAGTYGPITVTVTDTPRPRRR